MTHATSSSAYPKLRLFVEDKLEQHAHILLNKDQSHYVQQVMRAKEDDLIALFNGEDGEWLGELQPISKKSAQIALTEQRREQTACPDIWLVFAPIKSGRIDFLAQKATELGASALLPVRTRHTIVSRVNEDRLRANAIEAAEQCERLDVPTIHNYQTLQALLDHWPANRTLIYADETGQGESIAQGLQSIITPEQPHYALLIGPEGGFSTQELAQLRAQDYTHPISLGPRILRADTAALSALTCLQLFMGDWQETPSFRSRSE